MNHHMAVKPEEHKQKAGRQVSYQNDLGWKIHTFGYTRRRIYCPTRGMGEKPSPLGEDFSFTMCNISGFNPACSGTGVKDSNKGIVDFFTTP